MATHREARKALWICDKWSFDFGERNFKILLNIKETEQKIFLRKQPLQAISSRSEIPWTESLWLKSYQILSGLQTKASSHEGNMSLLRFYWKYLVTEITKEFTILTSSFCSHKNQVLHSALALVTYLLSMLFFIHLSHNTVIFLRVETVGYIFGHLALRTVTYPVVAISCTEWMDE